MSAENRVLILTSVRLLPQVHAELRQIAFDRRVSMHSLLVEGAQLALNKYRSGASATSVPPAVPSTEASARRC